MTDRGNGGVAPSKYPRIPYLVAHPSLDPASDRVLAPAECARWLTLPCLVEEKLDGANIRIAVDRDGVSVSGRSGSSDGARRKQLGSVRAYVAEHRGELEALSDSEAFIFAEWLGTEHAIHYRDEAPRLVVLDIWTHGTRWWSSQQRDDACRAQGLAVPPSVHTGVIGSLAEVARLHGRSRWADGSAEGLVLRFDLAGGVWRRAKWISPTFTRRVPGSDRYTGNTRQLE